MSSSISPIDELIKILDIFGPSTRGPEDGTVKLNTAKMTVQQADLLVGHLKDINGNDKVLFSPEREIITVRDVKVGNFGIHKSVRNQLKNFLATEEVAFGEAAAPKIALPIEAPAEPNPPTPEPRAIVQGEGVEAVPNTATTQVATVEVPAVPRTPVMSMHGPLSETSGTGVMFDLVGDTAQQNAQIDHLRILLTEAKINPESMRIIGGDPASGAQYAVIDNITPKQYEPVGQKYQEYIETTPAMVEAANDSIARSQAWHLREPIEAPAVATEPQANVLAGREAGAVEPAMPVDRGGPLRRFVKGRGESTGVETTERASVVREQLGVDVLENVHARDLRNDTRPVAQESTATQESVIAEQQVARMSMYDEGMFTLAGDNKLKTQQLLQIVKELESAGVDRPVIRGLGGSPDAEPKYYAVEGAEIKLIKFDPAGQRPIIKIIEGDPKAGTQYAVVEAPELRANVDAAGKGYQTYTETTAEVSAAAENITPKSQAGHARPPRPSVERMFIRGQGETAGTAYFTVPAEANQDLQIRSIFAALNKHGIEIDPPTSTAGRTEIVTKEGVTIKIGDVHADTQGRTIVIEGLNTRDLQIRVDAAGKDYRHFIENAGMGDYADALAARNERWVEKICEDVRARQAVEPARAVEAYRVTGRGGFDIPPRVAAALKQRAAGLAANDQAEAAKLETKTPVEAQAQAEGTAKQSATQEEPTGTEKSTGSSKSAVPPEAAAPPEPVSSTKPPNQPEQPTAVKQTPVAAAKPSAPVIPGKETTGNFRIPAANKDGFAAIANKLNKNSIKFNIEALENGDIFIQTTELLSPKQSEVVRDLGKINGMYRDAGMDHAARLGTSSSAPVEVIPENIPSVSKPAPPAGPSTQSQQAGSSRQPAGSNQHAGPKQSSAPNHEAWGGRLGGALGVVFGGMQLFNGVKQKDIGDGALGVANITAGGLAVGTSFGKAATMLAKAGVTSSRAHLGLGAAAVASIAYEASKEKGTGADDRLNYQAARATAGAAGWGAGMLAGKVALSIAPGPWAKVIAPVVAGVVVGVGTTVAANHAIDLHKEGKIAAATEALSPEMQQAVATLSRSGRRDRVSNEDIFPDGDNGKLKLSNYANSDGTFGQPELNQLRAKASAAATIARLSGNEKYAELANSMQMLEKNAIAQLEQAAGATINTKDIASNVIIASGTDRPGSMISSNVDRAGLGAAGTVVAVNDNGPGHQATNGQHVDRATQIEVQAVPQGNVSNQMGILS